MEVDLTALADSANVSQEGKLNLLGIFDTIPARGFPALHPTMSFAFRLLAESEDQGKKLKLEVSLIDQDSQPLWSGSAEISVGSIPAGQFLHVNQIVALQAVRFVKPGRYRFRIRIEGRDEPVDTVFQVAQRPTADAGSR